MKIHHLLSVRQSLSISISHSISLPSISQKTVSQSTSRSLYWRIQAEGCDKELHQLYLGTEQIDRSISLSATTQQQRSRVTSIHPSSCRLVNHGPTQQGCKEEYEPWKWGATARYYAPCTKTLLPMRKSVPRSSRQSHHTETRPPDHCKETQTEEICCMDVSPVHQTWPKPPCKAEWKGQEDKADRGRGRKTRQTEEEVGRQHQGMKRPGVHHVPERSGEQEKMEETGREVICGAPATPAVRDSWRWRWKSQNDLLPCT